MSDIATLSIADGIGVITIDSPPVNVLSAAVRAGLRDRLGEALADPAVAGIVIRCAGRTFIAGADISEFGKPSEGPSFADLFAAIERSCKPVVAAIHGTALGGGFELTLCCHARIAARSARIGLPEVQLGILPGAGGTQRVPRLIGAAAALEMIASGKPVGADRALALGLIDEMVDDAALLDAAIARAKALSTAGTLPMVRDRTEWTDRDRADPDLFVRFRAANPRLFKGFKSPAAIVEAIEAAVALPFDEGLAREDALCTMLIDSPEAAAQQGYFFAEREAARIPGIGKDVTPIDIATVAVIGAGTMGSGITLALLEGGLTVTLIEAREDALDRGRALIARTIEGLAAKGRISAAAAAERLGRLFTSLDMGAASGADLVIEAVFEEMGLKREIFARLDDLAKPGAILASNTSFLDIDQIAAATGRPGHVVGLHFFSPANIMRLLEVVRGARTEPAVIATAMQLARRIGKVAVLSGVCDGFIANRLMAQRGIQADALQIEGTPIAEIDRVLTDYGFAMGHFQMMDLVGLDVIGRGGGQRTVMGDLVDAGRLGLKSGAGYYDYDEKKRPVDAPVTATITAAVTQARGIAPNPTHGDEALIARLLYPVVNEGAKLLEEGIALRASDIDVAAVLGYNWPVYRGGPLFWANQVGLDGVVAGLRALEARYGTAFRPAALLVRLAERGMRFGDPGGVAPMAAGSAGDSVGV